MSDVLFVVPAFNKSVAEECNGTLLLATILRENGVDVDIYRYYESKQDEGFDSFVESSVYNILLKKPKIVSFYCRGDCYISNIRVAERIKELNPETIIVFGGPQADLSAKETISRIGWVDYCCSGEGETTIFPLFSGLLNKENISHIRGLTYRNEQGEVVSNLPPDLLSDLDTLPYVDYSLLPDEIRNLIREKHKIFNIDVGRGCPYNCAYCSTSVFWKRKFRIKSPARIADEILRIEGMFGDGRYALDHDLFTVNKKNLYEFCKIMKEKGAGIRWACSSRADTIDKDVIEEMVSAGMYAMYLGIETGSPRMQKLTHKNLDLDKAFETIKFLKEKKVEITASFIYGFPEETEEDIEQTLQFAYRLLKMNISVFQFHLCAFFPGTEYYSVYRDQLVFAQNASDAVGDFGVKENLDFIKANEELFPFYFEYHSEVRDKFAKLADLVLIVLEMYKSLSSLDNTKFGSKRLVDLYLELLEANKSVLETAEDYNYKENALELICNYLSTVCDADEMEMYKDIFRFNYDLRMANRKKTAHSDVKTYNVDINAVLKGRPLSEIEKKPVMVFINKVGKKVSYVVKPMTAFEK